MDEHVAVEVEHEDIHLSLSPPATGSPEVGKRGVAFVVEQRRSVVYERYQFASLLVLVGLIASGDSVLCIAAARAQRDQRHCNGYAPGPTKQLKRHNDLPNGVPAPFAGFPQVSRISAGLLKRSSRFLAANVLVPKGGVHPNEVPQQRCTVTIVGNLDDHAPCAQQILFAPKRAVLSNDDSGNPVEENGAAAHCAGGKRRIQGGRAIDARGLPPCAFERVYFRVQDGTSRLHPSVVAPAKDPSVMNEDRADRNSALCQTLAGFV
jgi:hypothetical protein